MFLSKIKITETNLEILHNHKPHKRLEGYLQLDHLLNINSNMFNHKHHQEMIKDIPIHFKKDLNLLLLLLLFVKACNLLKKVYKAIRVTQTFLSIQLDQHLSNSIKDL